MPLKYVGHGEAILGFPAKDLSDEDILKFAKKFLVQNGLYVEVKPEPEAPAKEKKVKESDK